MSHPFSLLIESTKCIYPASNPAWATTAPQIMSNILPKCKVLFGVRVIKCPNKSRDDGHQKVVPGSGLITILLEFIQSRKNILPIFLLAFERNTRNTTEECAFVVEISLCIAEDILINYMNSCICWLLTFIVAIMTMEQTVVSVIVVVEKSGTIHSRRVGSTTFSSIRFVIALAMDPKSTVYRVPTATISNSLFPS